MRAGLCFVFLMALAHICVISANINKEVVKVKIRGNMGRLKLFSWFW